jgi:hypothetical protein
MNVTTPCTLDDRADELRRLARRRNELERALARVDRRIEDVGTAVTAAVTPRTAPAVSASSARPRRGRGVRISLGRVPATVVDFRDRAGRVVATLTRDADGVLCFTGSDAERVEALARRTRVATGPGVWGASLEGNAPAWMAGICEVDLGPKLSAGAVRLR